MVKQEDLSSGYWYAQDVDLDSIPYGEVYIVKVSDDEVNYCGTDAFDKIKFCFKEGKPCGIGFLAKVPDFNMQKDE